LTSFFSKELPHLIQAIWFSFTDTPQELQYLSPSLGSQPHLRQTTALLSTSELQFLQNMFLVHLNLSGSLKAHSNISNNQKKS